MKFRIQVVRVADDGAERMKELMEFRTAGRGVSATGADLPALREASVEQRRRLDFSAHGVRDSAAAEPTLESVQLSVDRERELSTAA